jgi:outer membrane protein assembly factor BamB
MASEQQTPIVWREHVFAIQPKDAGELREQLVCYGVEDPTRLVWSSGRGERFGLGPYVVAGDKILVLDDDGVLTLAEASTTGYRRLARAKVLHGRDAWGPLALADGRLLARDSTRMVCLDVGGGTG